MAEGSEAGAAARQGEGNGEGEFRFFDNRQKYLLFATTCSEKWETAGRVAQELGRLRPTPPALRVFDAGVGDGTVLSRLMRAMHARFPTFPFYIVGKEVSLEDVRLTLEKMPDRLFEHPATVLVVTNLTYAEAPWLNPKDGAARLLWKEYAFHGRSSHEFERQITALQPFLAEHWKAKIGRNGNPVYDRPVALVMFREDHRFLLDAVLPRPGAARADFDLVVASQPYRARTPAALKARRVVAPLARALAPGGRLIGIHSKGGDPGLEIVQRLWPDDEPFQTDRHTILSAVEEELADRAADYVFHAGEDEEAVFRYRMHTLPNEMERAIGTSTLLAAWNAAVYVAQIEDARLDAAYADARYIEATASVLKRHGGLWFNDETYVIERRR